jgi:hypothetical protein
MTHEVVPSGEHPSGPEHDHTLPEADQIPGDLTPEESDAAPLEADL